MESLNTFKNHPIIHQHGPKIALASSVVCLLIFLVSAGFSVRTEAKTKAENYAPQPLQAISPRNKRPNYRINDVVRANLFGSSAPKAVVKNAPKTTLDLTLQGILSATDNTVARAIINSGKKKKSKLYSVGDDIEGAGASIKEIRLTEVILNRNGSIESLSLKKRTSKGDKSVYTPISNTTKVNQNIKRASTSSTSSSGEPRKVRKPNFSGLDRALEKLDKT